MIRSLQPADQRGASPVPLTVGVSGFGFLVSGSWFRSRILPRFFCLSTGRAVSPRPPHKDGIILRRRGPAGNGRASAPAAVSARPPYHSCLSFPFTYPHTMTSSPPRIRERGPHRYKRVRYHLKPETPTVSEIGCALTNGGRELLLAVKNPMRYSSRLSVAVFMDHGEPSCVCRLV